MSNWRFNGRSSCTHRGCWLLFMYRSPNNSGWLIACLWHTLSRHSCPELSTESVQSAPPPSSSSTLITNKLFDATLYWRVFFSFNLKGIVAALTSPGNKRYVTFMAKECRKRSLRYARHIFIAFLYTNPHLKRFRCQILCNERGDERVSVESYKNRHVNRRFHKK